ncbi:MAG: thioredoxin family protein [Nitrososphaerales archaeon]
MLELGKPAPAFNLKATNGKSYSLNSFQNDPVLVVVFSCNHCPYVQAYENRLVAIQRDYLSKGVKLIAINSNDDKAYPEDSYPEMVKRAASKHFNFVYARDPDQKVVDAYGAVCTPHVFAFNRERKLSYRGRIDDSKEENKVTSPDLRNAIDDLLSGKTVRVADTKPFGCSIKLIGS